MQAREYENVAEPAVTMYSYGQPRVGNLPFSSDYGGCLSISTSLLCCAALASAFM